MRTTSTRLRTSLPIMTMITMIISRLNSQATTTCSQLPVPTSGTSTEMRNAQLVVEGGREVMDEQQSVIRTIIWAVSFPHYIVVRGLEQTTTWSRLQSSSLTKTCFQNSPGNREMSTWEARRRSKRRNRIQVPGNSDDRRYQILA